MTPPWVNTLPVKSKQTSSTLFINLLSRNGNDKTQTLQPLKFVQTRKWTNMNCLSVKYIVVLFCQQHLSHNLSIFICGSYLPFLNYLVYPYLHPSLYLFFLINTSMKNISGNPVSMSGFSISYFMTSSFVKNESITF